MAFRSVMAVEHYQQDYTDTEQWLLLFFFLVQVDDAMSNVNSFVYGKCAKDPNEEARLVRLQQWIHTYCVDIAFPIAVGWVTQTIHLLPPELRQRARAIDQEVTLVQRQLAAGGFQLWALQEGNKLQEYAEIARYITHRSMDEKRSPLFEQHTIILLVKYSVYVFQPSVGGPNSQKDAIRDFLAIRSIDVTNTTTAELLQLIALRLRQAHTAIAMQQQWHGVNERAQQALANTPEWDTLQTRDISIIMMPHIEVYSWFKTDEERRKAQQDLREGRRVTIDSHHRLEPAGNGQFHQQEVFTLLPWKWRW